MLFISKSGDTINTTPEDSYYQKVMSLVEFWESAEPSLQIKTSGSTGDPKWITIEKKEILASVKMTQAAFHLNDNDLFFCCLNVSHIAGMMMIFRALALHAELVVIPPKAQPFDEPERLEMFLSKYRGRVFFAFVPLQLEQILAKKKTSDLLRLGKATLVGGAALSPEIETQCRLLNLPIFATYGMTETLSHIALKDLRIENGLFEVLKEVNIKQEANGCLTVQSPSTNFKWLATNDLVKMDGKTRFSWMGRLDNVINSGGVKIQLEEIERKIQAHFNWPHRFFCFGLPDKKLGQKLIVVVENTQIDYKTEAFSGFLSKFEVPKEIKTIAKFIETPSGKIDKIKTIHEIIHR
jgi:o-succinylbenzoate---CoA ligase